jgi:regulator of RNase E activity RraA
VVLVKRDKLYLWQKDQPLYDKAKIPNSVDLPDTIIETMGLYMVRKESARKHRMRIGDKPYLLEAKPIEAIDVNFPDDFDLANFIAAGKREQERRLLNNLKNHLTSAMLSDIFDGLGVAGVVQGLKPNIHGTKILGRAKTLKLRKLKSEESQGGIYDALNSYHTIVPNDVIVVENEMREFAYFGELNANLAIRAGAVGAIIGGATRDSREVRDLGFPVFAAGTSCRDVKNRATLESINKKINLLGVEVGPGDLVFADEDGVAVIPRKVEAKVLEMAIEALNKEKGILLSIMLGTKPEDITKKYGDF